ncbi:MAG: hypothetical protein JNM27_08275 [Leptospirales bacterium]|nr:hypothetical protein [Leptospirales bacterium]
MRTKIHLPARILLTVALFLGEAESVVAEDSKSNLRPMLAGVGLVAGAIELSFAPQWSDYVKKAQSTDRLQLLIQSQELRNGMTGPGLLTQIFRNESYTDLKLARNLRGQAYAGTALLFGASAYLAFGPEHSCQ